MENKKTLSYLNSKAWYRALKVANIIFVVFCCLIFLGYMIGLSVYLFDIRNEYVKDQAEEIKNIKEIQRLQDSGYTTIQIVDNLAKKAGGVPKITRAEYEKIYGKLPPVEGSADNKPFSVLWLFLIMPLSLFLAWFISEIPRRIFYYIFLGTIKPEK